MFIYRTVVAAVMRERHPQRAWLHGFTTGVAVCGLAIYAKRKLTEQRVTWSIRDEGTIIPIE